MPDQMTTRSLGPVTFDEKKNSVRAVAATEKPVRVWDWQQYDYVDEVLRMDGMILPESGRVPLLDCHSRYGVKSVLGSAGDFQESTAGGFRAIEPEVTYSETEEGKSAAQKTREGHLTDYSVGYGTRESFWVPDGQKQIIAGDEYEGPVKVVTSWELRELSATPIGADEYAKARSKYLNEKERQMPGAHNPTNPKDPGTVPQVKRTQGTEPTPSEPVRSDPTGVTQADVDQAANTSQASERSRVMDILTRCSVAGMADAAENFIERGLTLDQVSEAIFQRMADGNPPVGAGRTEITADARDKFRSAAVDGLALRAGLAVDKPAQGHGDFRGRSLLQIGEEALTVAGENLRGMGKMEMAARILNMPVQGLRSGTTSDFPLIMSNVANKRLLTAWESAAVTWDIFCNVVDATDFKPIQGIDISALPELALINEKGEYKDVQVEETGASYFVKTFGNMFRLTRHMVVNDDLRAFQKIPMMFGSAAKRTINN
ncbi:MAG: hypothetical protein MI749_05515, partial [Desulfovibrionales bacterium]|nr:hypothetical protein [Desulfovibrionales bacterium]